MNSSFDRLLNTLNDQYITLLVDRLQLEPQPLRSLWHELLSTVEFTVAGAGDHPVPKNPPSTGSVKTCPVLFSKGVKAGVPCGAKLKGGAITCARHAKAEKKPVPVAVVKPSPTPDSSKTDFRLVFNKDFEKYWHPATGFVLRSSSEIVVVGKWDAERRVVVPLTTEDEDECERLRIKYVEKPYHTEINMINQMVSKTMDVDEMLKDLIRNSDSETESGTKNDSFSFEDSEEEFEAEIVQ